MSCKNSHDQITEYRILLESLECKSEPCFSSRFLNIGRKYTKDRELRLEKIAGYEKKRVKGRIDRKEDARGREGKSNECIAYLHPFRALRTRLSREEELARNRSGDRPDNSTAPVRFFRPETRAIRSRVPLYCGTPR